MGLCSPGLSNREVRGARGAREARPGNQDCPPGLGSQVPPRSDAEHLQIEDQVVEPLLRDAVMQTHCRDRRL